MWSEQNDESDLIRGDFEDFESFEAEEYFASRYFL